jgi:hypothetical protein
LDGEKAKREVERPTYNLNWLALAWSFWLAATHGHAEPAHASEWRSFIVAAAAAKAETTHARHAAEAAHAAHAAKELRKDVLGATGLESTGAE